MLLFSLLESHPRLCMVGSGQITDHRECIGRWLEQSARPALVLSSTINKAYFADRFKDVSNVYVATARTIGKVPIVPGLVVMDGLAQIKTTKHRAFAALQEWLGGPCWLLLMTDPVEFLDTQHRSTKHGAVLQALLGGTVDGRLLVDDEVGQQEEMRPYLVLSKQLTTAHYRQERERQEEEYAEALRQDQRNAEQQEEEQNARPSPDELRRLRLAYYS